MATRVIDEYSRTEKAVNLTSSYTMFPSHLLLNRLYVLLMILSLSPILPKVLMLVIATDVVNITRLGKKLEGRTRLIKVQLGNLNQKRKILSNAKKLKECSGTLQKVYVTPDLSVNER